MHDTSKRGQVKNTAVIGANSLTRGIVIDDLDHGSMLDRTGPISSLLTGKAGKSGSSIMDGKCFARCEPSSSWYSTICNYSTTLSLTGRNNILFPPSPYPEEMVETEYEIVPLSSRQFARKAI